MSQNSVKEWLARVASECGSSEKMLIAATSIKNENSRKLITEYAKLWARKLKLWKRA